MKLLLLVSLLLAGCGGREKPRKAPLVDELTNGQVQLVRSEFNTFANYRRVIVQLKPDDAGKVQDLRTLMEKDKRSDVRFLIIWYDRYPDEAQRRGFDDPRARQYWDPELGMHRQLPFAAALYAPGITWQTDIPRPDIFAPILKPLLDAVPTR